MRILHLLNHCGFANGNVHAAIDLACAQAARGDVPCIAAGGGDYVEFLRLQGIEHAMLDQTKRKPLSVLRMIGELSRLVERFKPDVIHAHMMTGAVIGAIVGRLKGVPLVTTVHNGFDGHATLMGLGRIAVGVSQGAAEQIIQKGVRRDKVRVVLNGTVGAPRRDFFPKEPASLRTPNFVTVTALHPRKGVQDMINAFSTVAAQNADVSLYIVGDGPDRAQLEMLAARSFAPDRIHFMGYRRDTKSFLNAGEIFLLTSHDEPFGLVLIEAREAGCAVVATNVGGVPEALDGGAAGMLTPPAQPDHLAGVLLRLLGDPSEVARLRKAARANLERWSVDRMAAEYAAIYQEALGAKPVLRPA